MENVVIFYDHLEYFMAIWYNLCPFGTACGHWYIFFRFGMFGPRKIWQTCSRGHGFELQPIWQSIFT
jgi:hypothetical protein